MMFVGFIVLVVILAIIGGAFLAVVAYLRLVMRANNAGKAWVMTLPRVAFPLFVGNVLTHAALGSAHLAGEMDHWYVILNVASVLLIGIAAAHLTIRKFKSPCSETVTYSFLALAVGVIAGSIIVACI